MRQLNKSIENCLQNGRIFLLPYSTQIVAHYSSHEGIKLRCQSDRGIDHLLMILVAEIDGDGALRHEANAQYSYPLSIQEVDSVERMLLQSVTHMCLSDGVYTVTSHTIQLPSLDTMPSLRYTKYGKGSTLEQALLNAVDAEFDFDPIAP